MIGFDFQYLIFMAPAFALALIAQILVKSTFSKYSHVASGRGLTGAEAARLMMRQKGIHDVAVEPVNGMLTDHYDPRSKTLRLSESVYASHSLAAIGVACHEAGHALQHANGYAPLKLRSALVPATNLGSTLSYLVILIGFLMSSTHLIVAGCLLFSLVVLFALVTLPVEWDASRRAKLVMVESGIVSYEESAAAGRVLNAAFLTYVAAAVSSLMTLIYYLMRAGLLGRRQD